MDYDEEQANELEALEAIYAQDFYVVSADAPRSFELVVVPNADGVDNHVSLRLLVDFPATYPAVPANVRMRSEKGLVERQMQALQSILEQASAASVGEVSIYTIAEALREYLLQHNKPELSMHAQMEAREKAKDTEEEERIAKRKALEDRIEAKKLEPSPLGIEPGTLVTPESFARWRALFDAEQRAIREAKDALKPKTGKLTGKQLFLQNLAKELDDSEAEKLVESVSEAPQQKPQAFFFDASLYEDEPVEGEQYDELEDDDASGDDEQSEETKSMFDTDTTASVAMASASISVPQPGKAAASASSSSSSSSSAAAPPPSKPSPPPAASASSKPAPPKAQPAGAKKEAPKQQAQKGKKK